MEIAMNDPWYEQKLQVLQALYQVIDPELFVNIVDLGLIYDIEIQAPDQIHIRMTLSTPHCPLGEAIESAVHNALQPGFPNWHSYVNIVWEPKWTPDKISPEGRHLLGID